MSRLDKKELRLSPLFSSNGVVQMGRPVRVFGAGVPGRLLSVQIVSDEGKEGFSANREVAVNPDGIFSALFPPLPPGLVFSIHVEDEAGTVDSASHLQVGNVWFVSGQSNIDVTMERCRDSYPAKAFAARDGKLSFLSVTPEAVFGHPLAEVPTAGWKPCLPEHIPALSAVCYSFGRNLRSLLDYPLGIIQASLGGSRIASWMSQEMLEGISDLVEEYHAMCVGGEVERLQKQNVQNASDWVMTLASHDPGLSQRWQMGFPSQGVISLPCVFQDSGTPLAGHVGVVWLQKKFFLPSQMAGKPAHLWLGTMVDSDQTYLNGCLVGQTGYQYPPRKYEVPEGLLQAGENLLVVRLSVEKGEGRFTPQKGYFLFNDQGVVDLQGIWEYALGPCLEEGPREQVFINWKASGLFEACVAPCLQFPISGVVWYQGEANTHLPYDYKDLLRRYIEGYRRLWKTGWEEELCREDWEEGEWARIASARGEWEGRFCKKLPFLIVQLPGFQIDIPEDGGGWQKVRQDQLDTLQLPDTHLVVTIDLGEDNDLHPREKEQVGKRLAYLAARQVYGLDVGAESPLPASITLVENVGREGWKDPQGLGLPDSPKAALSLSFTNGAMLRAKDFGKGSRLLDFALEDGGENVYPCQTYLQENRVLLVASPEVIRKASYVRYVYAGTFRGALLVNEHDLPLSPFRIAVEQK